MKLVIYLFGSVMLVMLDCIPGLTNHSPRIYRWSDFFEDDEYETAL